jgi:hypothetical protein
MHRRHTGNRCGSTHVHGLGVLDVSDQAGQLLLLWSIVDTGWPRNGWLKR